MTNVKVQRTTVISDEEVQHELANAEKLPELRRLRARATLAFLETGKRRSEIVSLEKSDITWDNQFLYIRFTVRKKRKKDVRALQRTKKFSIDSPWAIMILEYLDCLDKWYVKNSIRDCKFVYPQVRVVFGTPTAVSMTEHANGQEIWRIIKSLNPDDWPHQHREKRAVEVIRAHEKKFGEAKLETIYRIRSVLDLEREQTAYNYIRRHETQKVEEEEEALT